jgi:[acyl-carrier-protein] S-malonyltransferase
VRQVSSPVRWEEVMQRLASEGVRKYVEVGPGTILTGLGRKILRDAAFVTVEEPADLEAAVAALLE